MANKWINPLAYGLLVVGGINWGTVQFFGLNLVDEIAAFASMIPYVKEVVYGAVAASAVYVAYDKWM